VNEEESVARRRNSGEGGRLGEGASAVESRTLVEYKGVYKPNTHKNHLGSSTDKDFDLVDPRGQAKKARKKEKRKKKEINTGRRGLGSARALMNQLNQEQLDETRC
jgi:hypothetical protein